MTRTAARRRRLCYVVSTPMTVTAFLKGHIAAAIAAGYDVTVVANTQDREFLPRLGLSATLRPVAIVRPISPWRDLSALIDLFNFFRRERFDIVHSVSPKAGLLAMLAGWLARVPQRVHTFTGQVWVTRRGWKRWLLKQADCLLGGLTTHALVDSPSQREFLVRERVLSARRAKVIGEGSICGVDAMRFRPVSQARSAVRASLNIPDDAPVLLFLGRLNTDKGVLDLARAFARLAGQHAGLQLLMVGPDEEGLGARVDAICADVINRLHRIDYTREPERFMAAADIFCLPSYREGFGMVAIEAAACGVPAVASRIYGVTDAVIDGRTGLLHAPGDVDGIVATLQALIDAPDRRLAMGQAARQRVLEAFTQEASSRELLAFYGKIASDSFPQASP